LDTRLMIVFSMAFWAMVCFSILKDLSSRDVN
jgi:hypothetical protein